MAVFYFFYGTQVYEFERPELQAKAGIKAEVVGMKRTLLVNPSKTRVVVVKR